MSFYADLHLHSRYAKATSRNADLVELAWWARRKGITVLGTGDFTHPAWFQELTQRLVPAEPGLYRLRDELELEVALRVPASCRGELRLMLATEVATAYRRDGRGRRMHHLLYAPDLETAARLSERLGQVGNLAEDGRPILAMERGGASDASHVATQVPLTIDGLGPRGGGAHAPQEYVLAPSLRERAEVALAIAGALLDLRP